MTVKTKEIWVRFENMESYRENEEKLCTLLRKAPGDCAVFIFLEDTRGVREMHRYSFYEKQISLLEDAFGKKNIKFREIENKREAKWNKPKEVPKIKQIIPCSHDMYALLTDEEGEKCKFKVLMFGLCSDGRVYPLHFDSEFGVVPLSEIAFKRESEKCLRRLHRSTEKSRENRSSKAVRDCNCNGDCDR